MSRNDCRIKRGGDLVDDAAMGLAGVARFVEYLVGFVRSQALVPEVDGQLCQFAQVGGECLNLHGLGCCLAIGAQGISDDNSGNLVAPAEAGEGAEVFARIAAALEGQHGLGGQAQFIGDSHADALRAYVEGEKPRWAETGRAWGLPSPA